MSHTNRVPGASATRRSDGFGNITGLKIESRTRTQFRTLTSEGRSVIFS